MTMPPSTSAAPLPAMPAGLSHSARDELRSLALNLHECTLQSGAAALTMAVIANRMGEIIGDEEKAQTYFCGVTGKPSAVFRRYQLIGKLVDDRFFH
jgi:hypothetical protein